MNKNWIWVAKYIIVIVAALVLGAVLGGLPVFRGATLGTPNLTAASLSQFIAQGGALAMLWMLGARAASQFGTMSGAVQKLSTIVLALTTLIVVASAYAVLMSFINPFLSRDVKPFIDWAFILGILGTAIWLIYALYTDAEAIIEALASRKKTAA